MGADYDVSFSYTLLCGTMLMFLQKEIRGRRSLVRFKHAIGGPTTLPFVRVIGDFPLLLGNQNKPPSTAVLRFEPEGPGSSCCTTMTRC